MNGAVGERGPRTVFLFGGQGSQFFGMGQALYASHAGFRAG